jgi:hydrogenase maturation factor
MSELGKASQRFLKEVILKKLGKSNEKVILGPKLGGDFAAVKIDEENVLLITSDPLSIIPSLGLKESAWITVHLLASDLATSGVAPQFAVLDYNLPPQLSYSDFEIYWNSIHEEMEKLGIAIIGGHTGKYEGCNFTVVGGGVMFSFAKKDEYVSSSMAKEGDALILTKGVAISASSILARVFKEKVEKELGTRVQKKLSDMLYSFSTVKDSLTAAKLGLRKVVHAMHDCTEGGLLGAIYELCEASEKGVVVYKDKIEIDEDIKAVCELFKIDPLKSLNEGGLLCCVEKNYAEDLIKELKKEGIKAFEIGEIKDKSYGRWLIEDNKKIMIESVDIDPYWEAFWREFRNK